MIDHLLQPLVCERFLTDARYREGHLRVVNALPERRVVGLHSPEIKAVAKRITREGGEVVMPDGTHRFCANGAEVICAFEAAPSESLCYEETVLPCPPKIDIRSIVCNRQNLLLNFLYSFLVERKHRSICIHVFCFYGWVLSQPGL